MTFQLQNKFEYKYEIQGLRVISILLVAIYHIWELGVSGGVDLFICISGYFMGIHYLKIIAHDKFYSAMDHFKSIIVRLLIPTYFFLIIFLIVAKFVFDPSHLLDIAKSIQASVLYLENVELIQQSYDYVSRDNSIDPLIHLWAVSIIGQLSLFSVIHFFVISKLNNKLRALLISTVCLAIASLIYSIYKTHISPETAYFDTFARGYEFWSGMLFAFINNVFKLGKRSYLTLLSFILFLLIGPLFGQTAEFPGLIGLLPVIAGAGILLFYDKERLYILDKILTNKYFIFCSRSTYPFYLWHWPIYVYVFSSNGFTSLNFLQGLSVLLISFIVSVLTTQILSPITKITQINLKLIVIVLIGSLLYFVTPQYLDIKHGAAQLYKTLRYDTHYLAKPHEVAQIKNDDRLIINIYGRPESDRILLLTGASHTDNWVAFFDEFGKRYNYKVIVIIKLACYFQDFSGLKDDCLKWNIKVDSYIKTLTFQQAILVTNLTQMLPATSNGQAKETIPSGKIVKLSNLIDQGFDVIGLRDSPRLKNFYDPVKCFIDREPICSISKDKVMDDLAFAKFVKDYPQFNLTDFSRVYCDDLRCISSEKRNIYFADYDGHMSQTFVRNSYEKLEKILFSSIKPELKDKILKKTSGI